MKVLKRIRNWLWRFYTWREGNRFTIGVFGAIFDDEGRILLVRQKGRNKWSLPGGGVGDRDLALTRYLLHDEDIFVLALFRELEEEVGIETERILRVGQEKNFLSAELKDIAITFIVKIGDGASIQPMGEIAEVRFVSQSEIEGKVVSVLGPRMARMIKWALVVRSRQDSRERLF